MNDKIILRGIHLALTPALAAAMEKKAGKLLRHSARIIRLRIDLDHDRTRGTNGLFAAKGHVEIDGPDIIASAASEDGYKSVDLLIGKPDTLLRRRHGKRVQGRNDKHRQAPGVLHGRK